MQQILFVGVVMLILIGLEAASRLFVDYQGHVMGARMESDMREALMQARGAYYRMHESRAGIW